MSEIDSFLDDNKSKEPKNSSPHLNWFTYLMMIGILLNGIGLTIFALLIPFVNVEANVQSEVEIEDKTVQSLYQTVKIFGTVIALCQGLLLLFTAIGLFRGFDWARTGIIVYGVLKIIFSIVGVIGGNILAIFTIAIWSLWIWYFGYNKTVANEFTANPDRDKIYITIILVLGLLSYILPFIMNAILRSILKV